MTGNCGIPQNSYSQNYWHENIFTSNLIILSEQYKVCWTYALLSDECYMFTKSISKSEPWLQNFIEMDKVQAECGNNSNENIIMSLQY
jgi:hypothetical protein